MMVPLMMLRKVALAIGTGNDRLQSEAPRSAPEGLRRHGDPRGGGEPAERAEDPGEPGEEIGKQADRDEQHDGLAALGEAAEVVDRLGAPRRGGDAVLGGQRREGEEGGRSEENTSELQSLMRLSYAVFCMQKKHNQYTHPTHQSLS